jgi:5-methylcytosine-specific restriction protein A
LRVVYCSIPGCPNEAVKRGRCREHGNEREREQGARKRTDGNALFYKSKAWQIQRRIVLARDPICRICGEQPSTEVDHVKAIEDGGSLLSLDNLQGACHGCHSSKTRREMIDRK